MIMNDIIDKCWKQTHLPIIYIYVRRCTYDQYPWTSKNHLSTQTHTHTYTYMPQAQTISIDALRFFFLDASSYLVNAQRDGRFETGCSSQLVQIMLKFNAYINICLQSFQLAI